jgi:hypothetical protein
MSQEAGMISTIDLLAEICVEDDEGGEEKEGEKVVEELDIEPIVLEISHTKEITFIAEI